MHKYAQKLDSYTYKAVKKKSLKSPEVSEKLDKKMTYKMKKGY